MSQAIPESPRVPLIVLSRMAKVAPKASQGWKPQNLAPCSGPGAWCLLVVVHLNAHFLINNKVGNTHNTQYSYYQ